MTSRSYNTGSSLIETLVTVIVLAIGLLGIATLQLQSKRTNFEAIQRSTASMLTNEIIERMRNNATQLPDYLTSVGGGSIATEPSPDCSDARGSSALPMAFFRSGCILSHSGWAAALHAATQHPIPSITTAVEAQGQTRGSQPGAPKARSL